MILVISRALLSINALDSIKPTHVEQNPSEIKPDLDPK